MALFSNIGLAEPSTITNRVAAVTIARGSTNEQQEILVLGDAESSLALARVLNVAPVSTDWGVVTRPIGLSTIVAVSSLAGNVRVVNSSALDLLASVAQNGAWTVGVNNQSTTVNVSSLAGKVTVEAFSTVWVTQTRLHDGASVALVGSTAAPAAGDNALAVRQVGYVAPSTTVQVSSLAGKVTVDQNSTVWNVQARLFDGLSVALVGSTAAPATGDNALVVRQVGFVAPSTTVQVSSLAGKVTVDQFSSVWAVQLANYSTIAAVSSLAGRVTVDAFSTVWVTQARLHDGQSNAIESAVTLPSSGARGLVIRPALGGLTTYSASTTGQSSATTILTSNAGSKGYIYAYSVISTLGGPVNWSVYAGATRLWGGVLAAVSSAVSGANLAVAPPGYLFAGSTGAALTFNVDTSNAGMNVSLAYWVSA